MNRFTSCHFGFLSLEPETSFDTSFEFFCFAERPLAVKKTHFCSVIMLATEPEDSSHEIERLGESIKSHCVPLEPSWFNHIILKRWKTLQPQNLEVFFLTEGLVVSFHSLLLIMGTKFRFEKFCQPVVAWSSGCNTQQLPLIDCHCYMVLVANKSIRNALIAEHGWCARPGVTYPSGLKNSTAWWPLVQPLVIS